MNDDLERRLERWGSEAVPDPDRAFADRAELDLRSQAYQTHRPPRPGGIRTPMLRPAMVLGAGLMLVAGAWAVLRDSATPGEVVMSEAVGTDVYLPGGLRSEGADGMSLPEGTRLNVNETGRAVVDGVILGGGTDAVVSDGRLEVLVTDPTATPAATTTALEVAPGQPTALETQSVATPADDPAAQPTTAAQPTAALSPSTAPTPRPTPTATTRSAPTAQPQVTTTPGDQPAEHEPLRVGLEIVRSDGRRALLMWSAVARDDIHSWEVLLIDGDSSQSIAVLNHAAVRELRVQPSHPDVSYVVRARDAHDDILGRSRAVPFPTR